ncbi:MAG: hypothetical protein QM733_18250 [Ilumatobacteraceae bacterium]
MLTSYDDFPVHQASVPMALTATSDANHYDRYFFNGMTRDGELYFAAAMGLYPNRHVVDAAFCVVTASGDPSSTVTPEGEVRRQTSVFASGRAPLDRRDATKVGPIRVEIVDPLHTLRLTVDAPEQGVHADLTFAAPLPRPRGAALLPAPRPAGVLRLHEAHPVRHVGGLDRGRRFTHRPVADGDVGGA